MSERRVGRTSRRIVKRSEALPKSMLNAMITVTYSDCTNVVITAMMTVYSHLRSIEESGKFRLSPSRTAMTA